ncbi:MAG: hypothetical protein OK436_05220 [Thaumarchaeota archaeon]|nr:hypothetical protein [Nitrososphaerota archaeon]
MGRAKDFERTSVRTQLRIFTCILVGLMILGSAPKAIGDSGGPVVFTFGDPIDKNESMYSLYYTVPSVIQTGVKENFTFYIYLTELSGWKIDSERQILTMSINTPSATVASQTTNSSQFLYQGARWGPFNMTMDLSASQVGLSPGAVTNATVYANLVVYERYNDPKFPVLAPDGKTLQVISFQIVAPGGSGLSGNRLLTSISVGAAVVLVLAGVALVTRKRGRQ